MSIRCEETRTIVTVNREDISTPLVETVLRALVFGGSPFVIPPLPKVSGRSSIHPHERG